MREAGPSPIFARLFAATVCSVPGKQPDSGGCTLILIYREQTGTSGIAAIVVKFGHRFYNSLSGRWLNRDPITEQGGRNIYGFVGNEPISAIDPNGLVAWITKIGAKLCKRIPSCKRALLNALKKLKKKCGNVRCRLGWHTGHQGKKSGCHFQLNCWIDGKKQSGIKAWRKSIPDGWCPSRDTSWEIDIYDLLI